ncbi:MAG: hypothetical protein KME46_29755 [Brasilonema angustatum HA4187-MV1]|jgi:hypothetical protein|nr:hypothetical protein [Brasilonema angustatum HA4187-MV1]
MSNAYRIEFNPVKVIEALNRKHPKLWATLSAKGKRQVTNIKMLQVLRSYELNVRTDLQDAEKSIQSGEQCWEEFLKNGERCSLKGGYQGEITRVYVRYWS